MLLNKRKFSGSTDGRGVLIGATVTPGTLIHTAITGIGADDQFDEIWCWIMNNDTIARKVTLEFGGATAGDVLEKTITNEDGPYLMIPGFVLQNALELRGFGATANSLAAFGFVNRIQP